MTTDGNITLKVATPAGVYKNVFKVTLKVHEVVDIVVKEKGLQKGDTFELAFDGTPLPSDHPIGSFGFEDETVLDLIASGSAV